jgi:hypothetical protein
MDWRWFMLISAKRLHGFTVEGGDEYVGTIKDLLFNSDTWEIEYLDVDTGKWLPGRRVILPPSLVEAVDYARQTMTALLRRDQVQQGPPLESNMPVSRKLELEFARYYAWGPYGANIVPSNIESMVEDESSLRSTKAVAGYEIEATDDEFGYVDDFIVDDHDSEDNSWSLRYFVVGPHRWLPTRRLLLSPKWVEKIDWATRHVRVDLTEKMIKGSPAFDPETPVNRQYEEVLYDYYGRPKYWKDVTDRIGSV